MLLGIDSGNTEVSMMGFTLSGEIVGRWTLRNDPKRTADEYAIALNILLAQYERGLSDIAHVAICSVVPQTEFHLINFARKYIGEPLVVNSRYDLGFGIAIPNPAQVGADRLVNGVHGLETYGAPLIVVDFGTATSFDIFDADRNFIGGVLAPGVNLSAQALAMTAEKLPLVAPQKPEYIVGDATIPAVQSGLYWGYVAMIEGILQRIVGERKFDDPAIISTGGLGRVFVDDIAAISVNEPDLTLIGLYKLLAKERQHDIRNDR
ncbi:MAG: type III pantothenate kinase [Pseudomonadota bacterium]